MLLLFLVGVAVGIDPERDLDVKARIVQYGYPFEAHDVTTEDGYIIEIHRIPHGRDSRTYRACHLQRPPIFLMHGLFASSEQFVINPPTSGLAFILADAGFDVWIGNARGNRFGLRHKSISTDDSEFWSFSWYDVAHYDLKSQIEYSLGKSGFESIYYIGHSQGTIVMFALLAEADAKWQKKIRRFHALAPIAGSAEPFAPLTALLDVNIQDLLGFISVTIPSFKVSIPKPIINFFGEICNIPYIAGLCMSFIEFSSEDFNQINSTRISVYTSIFPDSTSLLNILHWAQVFKYHSIRKMDYGKRKNLKIYGTETAPILNISNILAPTELWYSKEDHMTDESDVNGIIIQNIGPGLKLLHELDGFSHFDFGIGLKAPDEIYHPIINSIKTELDEDGCNREGDLSH